MISCLNCGSAITCSCQNRTARNGKKVCSSCLLTYERAITIRESIKPAPAVTGTAPASPVALPHI
jgi:hypothetical protein